MSEKKSFSIAKWFREMKSELKKVSWPSANQVYKNTCIVLIVCAIFAAITFAMDWLLNTGIELLLNL